MLEPELRVSYNISQSSKEYLIELKSLTELRPTFLYLSINSLEWPRDPSRARRGRQTQKLTPKRGREKKG